MTITPWQSEQRELTRPARRFLSQIRSGRSFDEAAARAGLSHGDVRTWLRSDGAFKAAYQQNLRNAGRPRVHNPWEVLGLDPNGDIAAQYISERFDVDALGIVQEPAEPKRRGWFGRR